MPGTLNIGQTDKEAQAFEPILSRAYCEGRGVALAGGLQNTNPHTAGSEAAIAWDSGWTQSGGEPFACSV